MCLMCNSLAALQIVLQSTVENTALSTTSISVMGVVFGVATNITDFPIFSTKVTSMVLWITVLNRQQV